MSSFENCGLSKWVCAGCKGMGFRKPFPIQAACIPAILSGKDVMGCAETGSGKTGNVKLISFENYIISLCVAAFALPILQKLSEDPYGIFAVILTPTRELAVQISEQVRVLEEKII